MNDTETKVNRRDFAKLCLKSLIGVTAFLNGCANGVRPRPDVACEPPKGDTGGDYDYIVVGSGAGGGPLAANLARKGHKVLLVEAGGDEENENYKIPLFHPLASEDPKMRWDFFVRHFKDNDRSKKDCKFRPEYDGVLYPRCSTLGGCTAHNAMILVYPHNQDWDDIAQLTGDSSWNSDKMRTYFERLENCQYAKDIDNNQARHGFKGWLPTSLPSLDAMQGVVDKQTLAIVCNSTLAAFDKLFGCISDWLKLRFDPNDWSNVLNHKEGLCKIPLSTYKGKRAGAREYVKEVERSCNGGLTVKLNTLVTKVILQDIEIKGKKTGRKKAIGIEYQEGERLYRADRQPSVSTENLQPNQVELPQYRARREVILSGGAFNTPQLLMLSGIGPKRHLQEMDIPVKVDLPGVGQNLQDRYEIAVITEMKKEFSKLKDIFKIPKPGEPHHNPHHYDKWQKEKGVLTSNGAVISFIKKSNPQLIDPDLFIFGMPGYFAGYEPDYSKRVAADQKHFTWAILKAHTNNNAGVVRLKSVDPLERPYINFHYFDEGNDCKGEDLKALVHGMEFVRNITRSKRMRKHIAREVVPGSHVKDGQLAEFAKYNAWGHHASCSCKMGAANDESAVVDSRFRVRNVDNLRIVDASIFPKIPGFFIVSAVYMISEKASDVIHEDALSANNLAKMSEKTVS